MRTATGTPIESLQPKEQPWLHNFVLHKLVDGKGEATI